MAYTLFFLFLLVVIFFYFLFKIRTFIARDRASTAELEANLTLLNLEMQKQHHTPQASERKTPADTSRASREYPPAKQKVIAGVSAGINAPEGWDFAIRLHTGAESYLGAALYKSLEKRVATLPGVDRCLFRDNGIFLLRSSVFTEEIVVDLFWREFLHAAEVAHLQKQQR